MVRTYLQLMLQKDMDFICVQNSTSCHQTRPARRIGVAKIITKNHKRILRNIPVIRTGEKKITRKYTIMREYNQQ